MIEMKLNMVDDRTVNVNTTATGSTDTLLHELAVGCADLLLNMAADRKEVDGLAQGMAAMLHSYVLGILAARAPLTEGVPDA